MSIIIYAARRHRLDAAGMQRAAEDRVIEQAKGILMRRMGARVGCLGSPSSVRDYLTLALAAREEEVFLALMLDTQHRLISAEVLFTGTLSQTSVYPREVVKAALARNAGAIIFAHNHPSGVAEHSQADELITRALKGALALVDVRVIDHFIVAGGNCMSFAERGLI